MYQNGYFQMLKQFKISPTQILQHVIRISGLSVLLFTAAITSAAIVLDDKVADNAKPASDPGLFGILFEEAPNDLTEEQFAKLDNNWAEWSQEVAYVIADIYEDDTLGVKGQREKLAVLKIKLETMKKAIDNPDYTQLHTPLVMLHGRLVRRVDFANAILDTLALDIEKIKQQSIKSSAVQLKQAAKNVETEMNNITHGSAWLTYLQIEKLKQVTGKKAELEVVLNVQAKIASRDQLDDSAQKEFFRQPVFSSLSQALNSFVSNLTNKLKPANKALLRQQLKDLVTATEQYSDKGTQADALKIKGTVKAISQNTPDSGATIQQVIDRYYRGDNLRVAIGEDFMTRLLGETTSEQDTVDDYFNGARSIGTSNTTVAVTADIKPSESGILFDIVLNGDVTTNTVSYASQANARICATGNHTFRATRELIFDGDQIFATNPTPLINVNPNLNIYGAGTQYDGWPLLGSYARNKAFETALSRRYSSEQHAADEIRKRISPEFQSELDNRLPELNDRLAAGVIKRLKDVDLFPARRSYRSSDSQMFITSLVHNDKELGGSVPNYETAPSDGIHISIHESMLNNLANRLNLAGRTMSEEDVKKELEAFVTKLTGKEFNFNRSAEQPEESKKKKDSSLFVFDKTDPVRFDFSDGQLNLTLRCGFKQQEAGKEDIPPHEITIGIVFSIEGDDLHIKRDEVIQVSAINENDASGVRSRIIGRKISNAFPDRKRSRHITLKRPDKPDVVLNIDYVQAMNGWMSLQAH